MATPWTPVTRPTNTPWTSVTRPTNTPWTLGRLGGAYLLDNTGDYILDSNGERIVTIVYGGDLPFISWTTRPVI